MVPLNLKVYTMDLHIPELDTLCELLTNLPLALPCRSEENTDYPFLSFEIHGAVLQRTNGDVIRALSESLWSIFFADGELLISERGPCICAVVDVLRKYLSEHPNNPILHKWVRDIGDAARKVYNLYGVVVSHPSPSFNNITWPYSTTWKIGASILGTQRSWQRPHCYLGPKA
jgi:hypothetical protein